MEDIKTLLKEHTEEISKRIGGLEDKFEVKTEEIKRHFGVAQEDFDSKIKLIAESVSGIQEQLVAIREMVAKNTEDIEVIKSDTQIIKQGLKRKVDLEEFELLERRVVALEVKSQRR